MSKWVISDILLLSDHTFHDWENITDIDKNEKYKVMNYVKYWCDQFLVDNISDEIRHCCYDLTLLFVLEELEYNDQSLDNLCEKTSQSICTLLTCNRYTKSGIELDDWKSINMELKNNVL